MWTWSPLDRCTLCGSPDIAPHYAGDKRRIPMSYSQCNHCTSVFQNPRPTPETMAHIFEDDTLFGGSEQNRDLDDCVIYYDYSAYENALHRNAVPLLRKIARHAPPPARLLEVGGATGWFLHAARAFGYTVSGVDISARLAGIVKTRYDIDVVVSPIETAEIPAGAFDVVCSFGGIECWMDANAGIANVHRALTRNGIFFFNYIDCNTLIAKMSGKKYYQYNPATNYLFNARAMHRVLNQQGFRVLSEKMPFTHISLGPLFHYFGMKKMFRLSAVLGIDKCVFRLPNVQARTVIAVKG